METDKARIEAVISEHNQRLDQALHAYLPAEDMYPARLHQAMHYSLFAGGKRLRPVLALEACRTCGGTLEAALPGACALEMVHTYSLIHDDLPAMDNDDLRRGRPTNHKAFDEATAILAGDALLTEAFRLTSAEFLAAGLSPAQATEASQILARAAGSRGMVGGQMADMLAEQVGLRDAAQLEYIHTHKTGALLVAALEMGAVAAAASEPTRQALRRYGEHLGMAFQITDDILDVTGNSATLGKGVGTDAARGKLTYPALHGLKAARQRADELSQAAVQALAQAVPEDDFLAQLPAYLCHRQH